MSKKIKSAFIDIRRLICNYCFIFLEILTIFTNYQFRILTSYRKKIVEEELKYVEIFSDSKILIIGCGSLPSTAIIIATKTNIKKIIAIDNRNIIKKIAEFYIDKKQLSNKIIIEHGNGNNYKVDNFDIIFMAANVYPLKSILKNLYFNMKSNSVIICRNIRGDIEKILEEERLLNGFVIKASF